MKKTYLALLFGSLCVVAGLVLSGPALFTYLKGSIPVNGTIPTVDISQAIENEEPRIEGQPSHIQFPRQNVSVSVVPGYFDAGSQTWTLSNDKAHFATVTPQPNNKTGNTFIYGHNRSEVFARLIDSALGDVAIVTTANGYTFTYKLVTVRDVEPDDVSAVQDHKSPVLTVQTCSGVWFEKRRMFTYELTEAR